MTDLRIKRYRKRIEELENENEELKSLLKTYDEKGVRPYLLLYNIHSGKMTKCSINKGKMFQQNPFKLHSIIDAKEIRDVEKKTQIGDKWVGTGEFKQVLFNYKFIFF